MTGSSSTDPSCPVPPPGIPGPLTTSEVAAVFRVTPGTVRRWRREGRLKAISPPGGHGRYSRAAVHACWTLAQQAPARKPDRALKPSALIRIGASAFPVCLTPEPSHEITAGSTAIVLGCTTAGNPVILTVTTVEWLDDLESAVQAARAAAIAEAGMQRAGALS